MEGDRKKDKKTKKAKRSLFNVRNVFPTIWLRFSIQANNGLKWFLLDSRYYFLFNFRMFLVIIYIIIKTFKKL